MIIKTATKIRFLFDEVIVSFLFAMIAFHYENNLTLKIIGYTLIILTVLDLGILVGNKIYGKQQN